MGNKKKKSKRVNYNFKSKGNEKVTRNYKDTVFVDLFTKDIYAKRNIVSLVNAIYDSDLDEREVSFKVTRLDNVLYRTMQNDVGVLLDNNFLILGEHQSTLNDNMPLRCLMYVSRIYEQLVKKKNRYSEKLIKIPYPQFFVFYNGERNIKDYKMRLSDAFIDPKISLSEEEKSLELVIHFVNINLESKSKLLEKCKILDEYAHMISRIKSILATQEERNLKLAMEETIEWCMGNDILAEYLSRKGTEVCNMLIAEYDDKERIEVISKEHYQEGYDTAKKEDKEVVEKAKKETEEAKKETEEAKKETEEAKKETEEAKKELKKRDILNVIDKILTLHEFVDDNDIIKSKIDDVKDIDIDVDNVIELFEKDKLNKDEIYARLFEKECDKQSLED